MRAQARLEPRGKSETTGRAAVTHASRARGRWDLILLWPWLLPGLLEGKQPRKAQAGPAGGPASWEGSLGPSAYSSGLGLNRGAGGVGGWGGGIQSFL